MMLKRTTSWTLLVACCFTASAVARRGVRNRSAIPNHRKNLEWADNDELPVSTNFEMDHDVSIARPFYSFSMSCKNPKKGWCSRAPSSSPTDLPTTPPTKPPSTPTRLPTKTPTRGVSTRAPTRRPTTVPPTRLPTRSPITDKPSPEPTEDDSPTFRPTSPNATAPTLTPTVRPTKSPTVKPTTRMPTSPPTKAPVIAPTKIPTKAPTKTPTKAPTKTPTREPTKAPTKPPSLAPATNAPTRQPTPLPTEQPTPPPTVFDPISTASPTVPLVETETFGNGTITKCNPLPTGPGVNEPQILAFKYNLYIPVGADVADAVSTMELKLHFGMAEEFLLCNFDGAPYYITAVFSNPLDTLTTDVCETANDPVPPVESECFVVIAEMSMTAFVPTYTSVEQQENVYPPHRQLQQTKAYEQVLIDSSDYLTSSMSNGDFVDDDIVQVSFQGFINSSPSPKSNSTSVSEANLDGSSNSEEKNQQIAIGSSVAMLVAMCLTVAAVMSLQRRRRQRDAYIKHLEKLSDVGEEEDYNNGPPDGRVEILADGKVHLVLEDYDDFFSVESPATSEPSDVELNPPDEEMRSSEEAHPNVHYCNSVTCDICRHRVLALSDLCMDLCRSASTGSEDDLAPRSNNQRHYLAPDTVIL